MIHLLLFGPRPSVQIIRGANLSMATPELAIAKAALSAALFRADPTSTSRPSVDSFFQLLNSALTQCSRPNVQVCCPSLLCDRSLPENSFPDSEINGCAQSDEEEQPTQTVLMLNHMPRHVHNPLYRTAKTTSRTTLLCRAAE